MAKLVKIAVERKLTAEQEAALKRLFSAGIKTGGRMYTREEIYEERLEELSSVRSLSKR